ncbi:efflux RND transporter periplasmic adaptor subunit [Propionivibrio dicarboxylicus]|uniref:Membrane fusion protein, Cu(I)/Ag(I) efflux system n=1 Tax=Propionivibrio dicarboxylicus TaxID=83767 RepID=A0A1G8I0T0_9RHOO|nr:efflux RND transporter periplasmic adaptor subunit [Propionivibrio dicarboxylicus]SDI12493.1 membrane fusion protein, Cu(I)/Ag(I) efflux system [Propionivibrio dicarboxylicus]
MTSGNVRTLTPAARLIIGLLVAVVAAGGGYWAGRHGAAPADAATPGADAGGKGKKLLFYRNPMGLPDTSPVPKKDPMGMDYIAVYEGDTDDDSTSGSALKISTAKVQKLGVRTEAATRRVLERSVRAAGRVEPDERRLYAISPKFEGYVERLHVNVTGQPVGRGQPLFEVYSPELVSAQREYAIAAQGVAALGAAGSEAQSGMKQLADASLLRLRNWDISDEQIRALAQSGETKRTLTFRSPVSGIVTEKKALQGMRFMPGEALYQIADLSAVWVVADVFEQDIGLVRTGARASVRINAYPGKTFEGTVGYVYPTLNATTRTVPVRVELANPGLLLKPAMFAQVEVAVGAPAPVVTVPLSAVIDSGTRQLIFVAAGEGRFEPRQVKLGARSDSHVEVIDGVKEGEPVVVAANFLIDAESNLKAAIGGFGNSGSNDTGKPATASVGHHARGQVDEIDAKGGVLTITHGPVASLKWPAMTMEFKTANAALLAGLKPGAGIEFEFVERAPGEWVITALRRDMAAPAHAGH